MISDGRAWDGRLEDLGVGASFMPRIGLLQVGNCSLACSLVRLRNGTAGWDERDEGTKGPRDAGDEEKRFTAPLLIARWLLRSSRAWQKIKKTPDMARFSEPLVAAGNERGKDPLSIRPLSLAFDAVGVEGAGEGERGKRKTLRCGRVVANPNETCSSSILSPTSYMGQSQ